MKNRVYRLTKKIIIISFIVGAFLSKISSQDSSNQIEWFPTIARIDSLNNYALNLEKSNIELRKLIGQQCYKLSELNNYELGLAQSLNNIGASYFHKMSNDTALTYFKNAFYYANKIGNREWKTKTAINIAETFSEQHLFDSSIVYYKKGMSNAVHSKDSISISKIYNLFGVTFWRKGRFNQAIKYYKASLKINKKLDNPEKTTRVLNNIGASYYQLGNYNLALNYYIEASKTRKKFSNESSPVFINNIGLVYLKLKEISNAGINFNRALKIAEETNDLLGKGYSYLNLGDLFFQTGEYDIALENYNKSLKLYEKLNDINAVTKIGNRIGEVYIKTDRLKLAKKKFIEAYKISKKNGLKLTQTESLINYCKTSILRGKNKGVKTNLENAYNLALEGGFAESRLKVLELQSQVFENLKDYKSALAYHKKHHILNDSLFNEKSIRIISETKAKYETGKKERENNRLLYLNSIQKLELENQTRENIYITIASVVFFFIIVYLFYLNSQRKRRNKELLKAKKEVEEINLRLNETNKLLENSNSTKDKFFSIIAHDLKNPFNTLLGASQLLNSDEGEMEEEEKKELIEIISNDSNKLYSLLENLLFWANSQTGNLHAKKINIHLHKLVTEIVALYRSSLDNKNIKVEIEISEQIIINFDEFMFSTIIRNLLSNAMKFSYSDSKILIIASEMGNKVSLKIIDEGMGIEEKNLRNMFSESSDFRELGTDNEKGTGLGLILCKEFISENNSNINVTSKIGKGTTFELILEEEKK